MKGKYDWSGNENMLNRNLWLFDFDMIRPQFFIDVDFTVDMSEVVLTVI